MIKIERKSFGTEKLMAEEEDDYMGDLSRFLPEEVSQSSSTKVCLQFINLSSIMKIPSSTNSRKRGNAAD